MGRKKRRRKKDIKEKGLVGSLAWEGKKVETRKEQKKKRKKVEGRD